MATVRCRSPMAESLWKRSFPEPRTEVQSTMRCVVSLMLIVGLMSVVGCGKKAETAVESPFALQLRCAGCDHEFALEYKEIESMKKAGTAIVPDGELLNVTCPSCGELKAKDADPRLWPPAKRKT